MTNIIEKIAEITYKINCIKELPDLLISEFLKQQTIEAVFFFSFFLLVAMAMIVVLKQYEFLSSQAFFAAVFALFGSVFMICHNLNNLFQIFFTPNLYLIENIKELVAK
jgi:hypothetical protein